MHIPGPHGTGGKSSNLDPFGMGKSPNSMYNWGTQKRDALMLKIVKIGPEDPFPSIPQFEFVTGYPQITPGLSSISVEKKWPS